MNTILACRLVLPRLYVVTELRVITGECVRLLASPVLCLVTAIIPGPGLRPRPATLATSACLTGFPAITVQSFIQENRQLRGHLNDGLYSRVNQEGREDNMIDLF